MEVFVHGERVLRRHRLQLDVFSPEGSLQSYQLPSSFASERLLGASLSPANELLMFHTEESKLEVLYVPSGCRRVQKVNKASRILGYYWHAARSVDFVLVSEGGVRFYKCDSQKVAKVNSYFFKAQEYWLEPSTGLLAVHEAAHPQVLRVFLSHSGVEGMKLDLGVPLSTGNTQNTASAFLLIYRSPTLLRLLFDTGVLHCFSISAAATYKHFEVSLTPGPQSLFLVDNVVVLLHEERRTAEYVDVLAQSQLLMRDECVEINGNLLADFADVDSRQCVGMRKVGTRLALCKQDVVVTMQLNSLDIASALPTTLSKVQFLLHRTSMKHEALSIIRRAILQREPLEQVSAVFAWLSKVYLSAGPAQEEEHEHEERRHRDVTTVISQTDMYENVLLMAYEAMSVDAQYFPCILLEYLRQLHEQGIAPSEQVQLLAAKLLLETERCGLLAELLNHRVLTPSTGLSFLLANNSQSARCSPMTLHLAAAVLYSLKDWQELTHLLLSNDLLWELLQTLPPEPQPACVSALQRYAKESGGQQLNQLIYDFIDSWTGSR